MIAEYRLLAISIWLCHFFYSVQSAFSLELGRTIIHKQRVTFIVIIISIGNDNIEFENLPTSTDDHNVFLGSESRPNQLFPILRFLFSLTHVHVGWASRSPYPRVPHAPLTFSHAPKIGISFLFPRFDL